MKALLIEKTRQEKIIDEVQKRRNLFGLGLTSLIAACSTIDSAINNARNNTTNNTTASLGTIPKTKLEAMRWDIVPLDSAHLTKAELTDNSGIGRDGKKNLVVTVSATSSIIDTDFVATFKNGNNGISSANASVYQGLAVPSKYDLVVSSSHFGDSAGVTEMITGGIYIFWDIKAGGAIDVDDSPTANFLKVAGNTNDIIFSVTSPAITSPFFYQIGGVKAEDGLTDQPDMFFRSSMSFNILWDVTQHSDKSGEVTVTLGTSPGILQVQGAGTQIGPSFKKINNNEDYDMIVRKDTEATYILWDVAKYYDKNAKVVVNLADPAATDAKATHGLLTITGLTDAIKTGPITPGSSEMGFTDINKGGINDLAFTFGTNTYILFGEKVADRDGEKAKSYSVDLTEVATFFGSDTTKAGFFSAKDSTGADVAQAGYRFADSVADVDTLADITAEYAKVASGGLSEEVYWDVA